MQIFCGQWFTKYNLAMIARLYSRLLTRVDSRRSMDFSDRRLTDETTEEGQVIADLITIGEAARCLEVNPHYVKGLVHGMRIKTQKSGRVTLITPRDFRRLVREIK